LFSLLVVLFGLINARSIVDIHVHDTMFVVSYLHIGLFIGVFLLFQTLIYFLTDNYRQWRSMQYIHIISIVLVVLFGIGGGLYSSHDNPRSEPLIYADHSRFGGLAFFEVAFSFLFIFFLLGQLLFIVNLIAGFIRGRKRI
jgi:heme/copper-type cytochrome/quinol oxidase subunit 1